MIVNPKGEMKGSAITGPVAKECVRGPYFFVYMQFADPLFCRPTSGRVSRRTQAQSYEVSVFMLSPCLLFPSPLVDPTLHSCFYYVACANYNMTFYDSGTIDPMFLVFLGGLLLDQRTEVLVCR